jgi:hypothetical protein
VLALALLSLVQPKNDRKTFKQHLEKDYNSVQQFYLNRRDSLVLLFFMLYFADISGNLLSFCFFAI